MALPFSFTGNLGHDAELRFTKSGKALTTLNVCHTPRERKNGEWTDGDPQWFKVIVWGELPTGFVKGAKVIVIGELRQVQYDGADGSKKTAVEVNAESVGLAARITKSDTSIPTQTSAPAQVSNGGWDNPSLVDDNAPF